MSSPSEGELKNPALMNPSAKKAQGNTGIYEGKFISFAYPAGFEKIDNPKNSGDLEVVNYYSTDHANIHLAVVVVKESLANDPGYNLRENHPETYKKVLSSPSDVVFTSDKNGREQTEFIAHSGLVVSISMTVPGTKDLSKDFAVVSNSLQWQQ